VVKKEGEVVIHTYQENSLPVPEEKQKVIVPYQIQNLFGCRECEWRGTPMCPEGFKAGKIITPILSGPKKNVCQLVQSHQNGPEREKILVKKGITDGLFLCKKRMDYLKILSPDVGTNSISKWLKHYNMMQQQIITNKDYHRLRFHIDKLISLENKKELLEKQGDRLTEAETEQLKELEIKTWKVRNDYTGTWEKLMNFQDKQVDRDTPKKMEHEIKHVSMRDIMKQVSDYKEGIVVDADYEVLDED